MERKLLLALTSTLLVACLVSAKEFKLQKANAALDAAQSFGPWYKSCSNFVVDVLNGGGYW